MSEKIKTKWDVTEEEENRTILPANDCRRINGGTVAPQKIQKLWRTPPKPQKSPLNSIVVIDRLELY
jgi:hypothetical protein